MLDEVGCKLKQQESQDCNKDEVHLLASPRPRLPVPETVYERPLMPRR